MNDEKKRKIDVILYCAYCIMKIRQNFGFWKIVLSLFYVCKNITVRHSLFILYIKYFLCHHLLCSSFFFVLYFFMYTQKCRGNIAFYQYTMCNCSKDEMLYSLGLNLTRPCYQIFGTCLTIHSAMLPNFRYLGQHVE